MKYSRTIGQALRAGEAALKQAGIDSPRRNAELLLGKVMLQNRVDLYLNAMRTMSDSASVEYSQFIDRRLAGEPVQYITGAAPFYGRLFQVGDGVFIPRFESELLIERLIACNENRTDNSADIKILDLCCGTGVLGITAALELPGSKVTLVDNSDEAVCLAELNVRYLEVEDQVEIVQRDVLSNYPESWMGKFDYILANPPYIPMHKIADLSMEVQREPHYALTDGSNGQSFYRYWGVNLNFLLKSDGMFFCEIDNYIAEYIHKLLGDGFVDLIITRDLGDVQRVCEATLEN